MINIHLTRDEAARLDADGRVVLFRLGDIVKHPTPDYPYHEFGPPAEFVEAAKPCETCVAGLVPTPRRVTNGPIVPVYGACPDCHDGKRRVAVVVPCYCKPIREAGKSWPYGDCLVPEPCTDGYVTVGHVVVEWGPLLVSDIDADCPNDDHLYVDWAHIGGQRHVFLARCTRGDVTNDEWELQPDVDPQSLVGQYALGIQKVVS